MIRLRSPHIPIRSAHAVPDSLSSCSSRFAQLMQFPIRSAQSFLMVSLRGITLSNELALAFFMKRPFSKSPMIIPSLCDNSSLKISHPSSTRNREITPRSRAYEVRLVHSFLVICVVCEAALAAVVPPNLARHDVLAPRTAYPCRALPAAGAGTTTPCAAVPTEFPRSCCNSPRRGPGQGMHPCHANATYAPT